jgi:predicted anti-sigma-YlaC factor YlaD
VTDIPFPDEHFSCESLVEIVTDYLEGALPEELSERIDVHLARCPGCQSVVDQVREVVRLTGNLSTRQVDELDAGSRGLLMETFRDAHRSDRPD